MNAEAAGISAWERIGAPLALVAIVFAWWQPAWSAGVGHGDFPGHVALIETLARQLEEGPWFPLWTSDWNSGSSLLFWYIQPLFSSYLLLPFVAWFGPIAGIRIGGTVFLALAALAMYGLGLSLTRSRAAGFVGALFYVLHPSVASFVGEVGQIHQPVALALLPVLFWSWIAFARTPGVPTGTAACVTAALLFYDMERFWLTAPWAFLAYLVIAWRRSDELPPVHRARQVLGPAFGAGFAMTLLVAFPTLPAWFERPLLQWHDSSTLDVFRDYYSFPHLFALIDRAGGLADYVTSAPGIHFVALPGQWYQGGIALGFVALGCIAFRLRGQRDPIGLQPALAAGFLLAALAIASGVHAIGPRHWALAAQAMRGPDGGILISLAGLAVLLVIGSFVFVTMPRLRDDTGRVRTPSLLLFVLAFVVLLIGRPFVWLSESIFVYEHLRAPSHFAFPSLPLLLGILACLSTPRLIEIVGSKRRWWLVGGVTLLHLVDVAPYRFAPEWSVPDERTAAWARAFAALDQREPGRLLDTHHYNPMTDLYAERAANHRTAWGWLSWTSTREIGDLIKTGYFDSMRLARQNEQGREANAHAAASFAGLAAVRHVTRMDGISPAMPDNSFFVPVIQLPHIAIYENTLALSQVQFYETLAHLEGELSDTVPKTAALAYRGVASVRGEDAAHDPPLPISFSNRASTPLPAVGPPAQPLEVALARVVRSPAAATAPCEMRRPRTDRIVLDCEFESPGFVVVAEAWFPNWRVHDGIHERPALRLNHAFLGAQVSAGESQIEFRHHPTPATHIARATSGVAWAFTAVLAIRAAAIAARGQSRQSR